MEYSLLVKLKRFIRNYVEKHIASNSRNITKKPLKVVLENV